MKTLKDMSCAECDPTRTALTVEQARSLMGQVHPDWQLAEDGRSLRRELRFPDFYHTMSFVNALAHVANTEDHHPDLELGYGYCNLRFSTHDAGGLTYRDFICAAKADALA